METLGFILTCCAALTYAFSIGIISLNFGRYLDRKFAEKIEQRLGTRDELSILPFCTGLICAIIVLLILVGLLAKYSPLIFVLGTPLIVWAVFWTARFIESD